MVDAFFIIGHYSVQYWFKQVIFIPILLGNQPFVCLHFLISACSVFRLHIHKLYTIYVIIVFKGVQYSVILFSLYKEQFIITNTVL